MKRILTVLILLVYGFFSAALGDEANQQGMPCYGVPSETSVLIILINETGKEIERLWLIPPDSAQHTPIELLDGDVILAGERFGVWLIKTAGMSRGYYDLKIGLDDGKQMTLHGIDAKEFKEASLRCDVNVAFLTYTSLISGAPVSTWLDELKHLEQEESVDFPVLEKTLPKKTDKSEYAS